MIPIGTNVMLVYRLDSDYVGNHPDLNGYTGVVKGHDGNLHAIELAVDHVYLHRCNGLVPSHRGWCCEEEVLAIIERHTSVEDLL